MGQLSTSSSAGWRPGVTPGFFLTFYHEHTPGLSQEESTLKLGRGTGVRTRGGEEEEGSFCAERGCTPGPVL